MKKGSISFDFNRMFCSLLGGHGLSPRVVEDAKDRIASLHLAMSKRAGEMAWRALPYNQVDVVKRLQAAGKEINSRFDAFVVLGIGGSALGSKALFSACCHGYYNELPADRRGVRFYVEDNVDPDHLAALLNVIDVRRTAFHVISKSGNTVETMSQFLLVLDLLKQTVGDDWRNHIYLTTDSSRGILHDIAIANNIDAFVVPDGVGGRFSVLCPVGLLSAAVLGLDIDALLAGAAAMDAACTRPELAYNPAYLYALLYTEAMRCGANISVLMPYCSALAPLAEWYCQLWAESLGKQYDVNGRQVNCGQTPVRALGVTDQHSQLQLYNEGPVDKVISLIGVKNFRTRITVPPVDADLAALEYMSGKSFNELIEAEMQATRGALTSHGKMNNTIMLSELNEYTLGGLFFFFEMATAAAGELLRVNAFDQPGVEDGKLATFALMGRDGYADKAPFPLTVQTHMELTIEV